MVKKITTKLIFVFILASLFMAGCSLLPEDTGQLIQRGINAIEKGYADGAVQHLSNALKSSGNATQKCEIYSYLGWAYYLKNDSVKAKEYFDRASIYLKSAELYAGQLLVYSSFGDFNTCASFSYLLDGISENWKFKINGNLLEKNEIVRQVCVCAAAAGNSDAFQKYSVNLTQVERSEIEEVFFQ